MKYLVSLVVMVGIAVGIEAVRKSDAYVHYIQKHRIQTRTEGMPKDWQVGEVGTCKVFGPLPPSADGMIDWSGGEGIIDCPVGELRPFEVRYRGDLLSVNNRRIQCTRRVDYFWCELAK